jgi:hypothetical protein
MKKKLLAVLVSAMLVLSGCGVSTQQNSAASGDSETREGNLEVSSAQNGEFAKMSDEGLPEYIQDSVYNQILSQDFPESAFVENVQAVYISQEYIDELTYNSQSTIFFGYTIAELQEQFPGSKYVYTLGEDGQTSVHALQDYDDTYDQVIRNVAVGGGVILVCVTVSVATAGVAPACSMVFAVAASTGTKAALSGAAIGAITSGAATAIQTNGDVEASIKAADLGGSEGFMLGAIGGAIGGGAAEAAGLKGATLNGLTMNEAASIQRESKYPLDVIKQFKSVDEYNVYKDAGLKTANVSGKTALVQDIDLTRVDEKGSTNLQRMRKGQAPLDPSGDSYELHHINQKANGTLAVLSQEEHRGKGVAQILNTTGKSSEIDRDAFKIQKRQFWRDYASIVAG